MGTTTLRYHQTNETWQRDKCRLLGLVFECATQLQQGGPTVVLNRPNLETIVSIRGDGNCLFRCFSYILTGSQNHHLRVRKAIVAHMRSVSALLVGSPFTGITADIETYISTTRMWYSGTWGSTAEMLTLAHLVQCNIYSYNPTANIWDTVFPKTIDDSMIDDVGQRSMYLFWRNNNHFDVVTSQLER